MSAKVVKTPRAEDLVSVGTRVSWNAIAAGAFTALAIYFLLGSLGTAVGLSVVDKANPGTLNTGAVIWAFLTTIAALFVGGLVASLFTVGENKTEAVMSGVIVWALLMVGMLLLAGAGVRAGLSAINEANATNEQSASQNWEVGARMAGATPDQITTWRGQIATPTDRAQTDAEKDANREVAKRIAWITFAGTWISMLAAAAGGYVGAGPTFRIVAVRTHSADV